MSGLFRKISSTLKRLSRVAQPPVQPMPQDRRGAPRFICSVPVLWEVGRESGEGTLREVSATGLRLRATRAFLVGKNIRIRPLLPDRQAPLSTDVAIGGVIYSRPRGGEFEIGVEFINPERISRFAWLGQLVRGSKTSHSMPSVVPEATPPLSLVKRRQDVPHKPPRIGENLL